MSTIRLHQTTTSTPEQFIAGLTDFGPGRATLFGNSTDEYLKVHHLGPSEADVTEGSRGIWERLHYDWSDPDRVVMTTTDSNLWGGASGLFGSGRTVAQIDDSFVVGNAANGIRVDQAGLVLNRTAVQTNLGNGILARSGAVIHIGSSTVTGNFVAGLAYNGGQILSYGDNRIKGNNVDNAPSGMLALN